MSTHVQESSILAYHSLPNRKKKSIADLIYDSVERNSFQGGNGMSMSEIQKVLKTWGRRIEKSTISARINELVACKRLYRHKYLRKCSVSGNSIHPVSLPLGQISLPLEQMRLV